MTGLEKAIERIWQKLKYIEDHNDHMSETEGKLEGYDECMCILNHEARKELEAEKQSPCERCKNLSKYSGSCSLTDT